MYLDDRTTLPNDEVPGTQGAYVIEKFLGLGLTAQVYRARQTTYDRIVALKVLRHDASSVSQEHFWHEAQVLNEICHYGIDAVPEVYGQQKTGEIQFLAMEYVDRAVYQPLDERLEPLPEQEALEVARRALLVLRTLHEQVGRTYTDMQLKNFYWNAAARQLKILDWNHVSTQQNSIQPDEFRSFGIALPDTPTTDEKAHAFAALAQHDLSRWGAYLYRLLTGKGALEQGETVRALEKRAESQWTRISVAARQIVCRALQPDPAQRYPTAAAFLEDVTDLQKRWLANLVEEGERQALDELLDQAKEATITQPAARERLDEVEARLDLLERRGIDMAGNWLPGYQRRLERLTQGVSAAWSRGLLYYQGGQYIGAAQIWEPEVQAQGRLTPWRWLLLAQSGALLLTEFAEVRQALEQVVKDLDKEAVSSAKQRWETLKAAQPWVEQAKIPAHWLGVELAVAQQVQTGRVAELIGEAKLSPEDWEAAALAYEQAQNALKDIPYAALLRADRGWESLTPQVEALRLKSATYRATDAQVETLRQGLNTDFPAGLAKVRAELQATPGAAGVLAMCVTYARAEKDAHPGHALDVVDTALLYGQASDSTHVELQVLRQELQPIVKFFHQMDQALTAKQWDELSIIARTLPPKVRDTEQYMNVVKRVSDAFHANLPNSNLATAPQLAENHEGEQHDDGRGYQQSDDRAPIE